MAKESVDLSFLFEDKSPKLELVGGYCDDYHYVLDYLQDWQDGFTPLNQEQEKQLAAINDVIAEMRFHSHLLNPEGPYA